MEPSQANRVIPRWFKVRPKMSWTVVWPSAAQTHTNTFTTSKRTTGFMREHTTTMLKRLFCSIQPLTRFPPGPVCADARLSPRGVGPDSFVHPHLHPDWLETIPCQEGQASGRRLGRSDYEEVSMGLGAQPTRCPAAIAAHRAGWEHRPTESP